MEKQVIGLIKDLEEQADSIAEAVMSSVKFEQEYARLVGQHQALKTVIVALRHAHQHWLESRE